MSRTLLGLLALTLFATPSRAQDQEEPSSKIQWPRDTKREICTIAGKTHTVEDLIDHITIKHWSGMRKFVDTPAGQLYFTHPLAARWVRQFADSKALELEARQRKLEPNVIQAAMDRAQQEAFAQSLERYLIARRKNGGSTNLSEQLVENRRSEFRRHYGLRTEITGWLNALVPVTPKEARGALEDFYADNARMFGGVVDLAQILVNHRDPRTFELLVGQKREAALSKIEDIKSRLNEDGSNFEEVAALMSDDRRTAANGGLFRNVERFDQRLPAAVCRAAWGLPEGKFSGPVETIFGLAFVKKVAFRQQFYVPVFTEKFLPTVQAGKQRLEQERLVFEVRSKYKLNLHY